MPKTNGSVRKNKTTSSPKLYHPFPQREKVPSPVKSVEVNEVISVWVRLEHYKTAEKKWDPVSATPNTALSDIPFCIESEDTLHLTN